jgi:hypothetical protein
MKLIWRLGIGLQLVVSGDLMPRLTDDANIQIDPVHCRAICEEIGYRLRQTLGANAADHQPHLKLIDHLRQKDLGRQDFDGAPSIVPSHNDMGSRGGAHGTSTPLRKPGG